MSVYVAFLRGINVGGNNIIPMAALADTFRALRFDDVKTFIASGNVLFRTKKTDHRVLEKKIERAIAKAHGSDIKVVVRSREEMRALVKKLPASWKKPSALRRYYVMFLRHDVDAKSVLAHFEVNADMEELAYLPGALLWSATKAKITRSRVAKIISSTLYRDVTIRNLNTTLKVAALAEGLDDDT